MIRQAAMAEKQVLDMHLPDQQVQQTILQVKDLQKELLVLRLSFGQLKAAVSQAAEPVANTSFQWGDRNGWACLQLVAVEALEHCGRHTDAKRLAEKFVGTVERIFAQTGKLFEKYNVQKGDADAVSEYGTPEMMGWTAGVYLALQKTREN